MYDRSVASLRDFFGAVCGQIRRRADGCATPRAAALLGLIALVTLTVIQVHAKRGEADSTSVAFLGLAIVLLFGVVAPTQTSDLVRRITTFKFAGVELGLSDIKRAERVRPLPREDDGVNIRPRPQTGTPDGDYQAVVKELQGRLRFVWDILPVKQDIKKTDYVGITQRLRTESVIDRDEETFILHLLEEARLELGDWSTATQEGFLESAWQYAIRLGPLVWDRWVRQQLSAAGWILANHQQRRGHRPDFLGYREGRWAVMAARIAGPEDKPAPLDASADRLSSFEPQELVSGRVIVIPDIREGSVNRIGVEVVKLGDLLDSPALAYGPETASARPRDQPPT
jgi:hypothetical protein